MPFNLLKKQTYEFNFESLISGFSKQFSSFDLDTYFNLWKKVLTGLENDTQKFAQRFNVKPELLICNSINNVIFQFPFRFFDNQEFIFQFNISSIMNKAKNIKSESISVSNFSTPDHNTNYRYTYIGNVSEKYLISKPVLIAQFPDNFSSGLVIDGNHRVSAYKKYARKAIHGICISPIEKDSFGTPIDWGMYLFYNELWSIAKHISDNKILAKQLHDTALFKIFADYLS